MKIERKSLYDHNEHIYLFKKKLQKLKMFVQVME